MARDKEILCSGFKEEIEIQISFSMAHVPILQLGEILGAGS